MQNWLIMLGIDILIPLLMMVFGWLLEYKTPIKNAIYGYRTSMSMKNNDTWKFANRYCGKLWIRCGLILLPISITPMLLVIKEGNNTVGIMATIICLIQLIPLIGTIYPVEKALKNNFNENGNKK
jgi:uncharacterized membrane protein